MLTKASNEPDGSPCTLPGNGAKHIFLFYDERLGAHTEEGRKTHFEPRETALSADRVTSLQN